MKFNLKNLSCTEIVGLPKDFDKSTLYKNLECDFITDEPFLQQNLNLDTIFYFCDFGYTTRQSLINDGYVIFETDALDKSISMSNLFWEDSDPSVLCDTTKPEITVETVIEPEIENVAEQIENVAEQIENVAEQIENVSEPEIENVEIPIITSLSLGDIVSSSDEDYPLRSTHAWYRNAVVVNEKPLVLMSLDRTMRWDNFPKSLLQCEKKASRRRLKYCSIRYHNDEYNMRVQKAARPKGSIDYEYLIVGDDIHTVEQVFESLKQCLNEKKRGIFEVKQKFVIMIDCKPITCVTIGMGTALITNSDNTTTSLLLNKPFKNKLAVYAQVFQK